MSKSTKYSITSSERWSFDRNNPNLTIHLEDRYDERTPHWASSPEHAWTNGVDVSDLAPYLEDRGGQTPEKVRYYAESHPENKGWHGVILLVRDGSILTCYTHESLTRLDYGHALQAFLRTIAVREGLL